MWWVIPRYAMQIGVGTGIGVTLKGGSLTEVLAWTALTTGVSSAAGSGAFWRGAWAASNYLRIGAPLASGGSSILATGSAAGGIGVGAAVGAVAAGAVVGAVTGTAIVAVAERKEIVYAGATKDVASFYMLQGGKSATSRDRSAWYESDIPVLNIPGDVKFIAGHYWKKYT